MKKNISKAKPKPSNREELISIAKLEWNKISIDVLEKLSDSMTHILKLLKDGKGVSIKYYKGKFFIYVDN